VDHPTIQAGTTPGASAAEKRAPAASAVALGALLFCSASLNVAQFARAAAGADSSASALGQGYAPRVQPPLGNGNCAAGTVHACVQAGPGAAGLGMAPVPAAATAGAAAADSVVAVAAADADGVDSFVEAGTVPGRNAQTAASGGARYCRKDTWLLSCLFYKADINDELTDWRSVKAECDREPLCDGVNKYWTSDLWHISSSGEAPGCDASLMDGYGTDASAFYKEGSPGWNAYTADNSCHEVDEWGNPLP